jgi:predicted transcriptional regulator YdeE
MQPKIVNREAFRVMGVVGHFQSAAENFGPLWEKEYMAVHEQIEPLSAGEGHYGVYLGADHSKPIDYMAGMTVQDEAVAPQGLEVRKVPAALYVVFECSFHAIGPTYGHIWGEWLQSSPYEQDTSRRGFDYFPPGTTGGESPMQIWFPVKRRD